MTLDIVTIPDSHLTQRAAPVERFTPALRATAQQMVEAMQRAKGVGLAAPQVALLERFFVMRIREDDERLPPGHPFAGKTLVLINPEIVEASEEVAEGIEACLSIPGYAGLVERHVRIVVQARNEWGKAKRYEVDGFVARVMQHEIDHLDGILYLDRVTGQDKLFEVAPPDGDEPQAEPTATWHEGEAR